MTHTNERFLLAYSSPPLVTVAMETVEETENKSGHRSRSAEALGRRALKQRKRRNASEARRGGRQAAAKKARRNGAEAMAATATSDQDSKASNTAESARVSSTTAGSWCLDRVGADGSGGNARVLDAATTDNAAVLESNHDGEDDADEGREGFGAWCVDRTSRGGPRLPTGGADDGATATRSPREEAEEEGNAVSVSSWFVDRAAGGDPLGGGDRAASAAASSRAPTPRDAEEAPPTAAAAAAAAVLTSKPLKKPAKYACADCGQAFAVVSNAFTARRTRAAGPWKQMRSHLGESNHMVGVRTPKTACAKVAAALNLCLR